MEFMLMKGPVKGKLIIILYLTMFDADDWVENPPYGNIKEFQICVNIWYDSMLSMLPKSDVEDEECVQYNYYNRLAEIRK